MPIRCEEYNQVCVLSVDGDLTAENAGHLRTNSEERITNRQVVDFIVDLEKCGFIDSEGLETLLWLKRRSDDLFGQAKLVGLDENCRKILEITRLDEQLEVFDTVIDAVKSFA